MIRFCVSIALSCIVVVGAVAAESAKKPNILIILVDDMGFSDLGCFGGEIATPTLDGLAANGLRFTQAYNTARCWPTRGALLAGYYAQQIHRDALPGVPGGAKVKRPSWARLLPDYLNPLGYRSYHSGKWHIDGKVLDGGFHRSYLVNNQGNFFSEASCHIDDVPIPKEQQKNAYTTVAVIDHALSQLDDHMQKHADKPFFQYVAFTAPHFPLQAMPEDIARYRDRYLAGWEALRTERFSKQQQLGILNTTLSPLEPEIGPPYHQAAAFAKLGHGEVNRPLPWQSLDAEQQRFQATKMAIHAAMVDRVDQEVGRLIAWLRTHGQLDNTLLFFFSDNGASAEIIVRDGGHDPSADPGSAATYLCLGPGFSSAANTPFRRHKTWVHEGGISTSCIVHWPAGFSARGELRQSPIHVIDVVPTVLDVVGATKPAEWQGVKMPPAPGHSIRAAFATDVIIERDSLWWLHEGNRALRVGDWKIVAAKGDPWALYDLRTDRAEQHDLASEQPDRLHTMVAEWERMTNEMVKAAKKK